MALEAGGIMPMVSRKMLTSGGEVTCSRPPSPRMAELGEGARVRVRGDPLCDHSDRVFT